MLEQCQRNRTTEKKSEKQGVGIPVNRDVGVFTTCILVMREAAAMVRDTVNSFQVDHRSDSPAFPCFILSHLTAKGHRYSFWRGRSSLRGTRIRGQCVHGRLPRRRKGGLDPPLSLLAFYYSTASVISNASTSSLLSSNTKRYEATVSTESKPRAWPVVPASPTKKSGGSRPETHTTARRNTAEKFLLGG